MKHPFEEIVTPAAPAPDAKPTRRSLFGRLLAGAAAAVAVLTGRDAKSAPPPATTQAVGEEGGPTTLAIGEEGGPTTLRVGEEGGPTTRRVGEEGGPIITTHAIGEEGGPPVATTQAVGEEGGGQK